MGGWANEVQREEKEEAKAQSVKAKGRVRGSGEARNVEARDAWLAVWTARCGRVLLSHPLSFLPLLIGLVPLMSLGCSM